MERNGNGDETVHWMAVLPIAIPAMIHFFFSSIAMMNLEIGVTAYLNVHIILVLAGFYATIDQKSLRPIICFIFTLAVSAIVEVTVASLSAVYYSNSPIIITPNIFNSNPSSFPGSSVLNTANMKRAMVLAGSVIAFLDFILKFLSLALALVALSKRSSKFSNILSFNSNNNNNNHPYSSDDGETGYPSKGPYVPTSTALQAHPSMCNEKNVTERLTVPTHF